MIHRAVRYARFRWGSDLLFVLILAWASALLVALVNYTGGVENWVLQTGLAQIESSSRHLVLTGPRTAFRPELDELIQTKLGEALQVRVVIRQSWSPADPLPRRQMSEPAIDIQSLAIFSYDRLSQMVRVVEGRLPAQVRLSEAEEAWRPPPIEAVIGLGTSARTGYGLGDRLAGRDGYHRLDIVGIVEPLDPDGDIWGGDLDAFFISNPSRTGTDGPISLPLIISAGSMRSHYPEPPIFPHTVSWRFLLDYGGIDVGRATALHASLTNIQAQSATYGAVTSSGLVETLGGILLRLSRARTLFTLLTAQSLLLAVMSLGLFASYTVSESNVELAVLSARGANLWQSTWALALEGLLLALAALLLAPLLSWVIGHILGEVGFQTNSDTLSPKSWMLSTIVAGAGWVSFCLPALLTSNRATVREQHQDRLPSILSVVQRRFLDLYLLAFSGLVYWQLNQSGSLLMRRLRLARVADPFLLLAPSLFLTALALVLLRIWPLLLGFLARLFSRSRGWRLPLALTRLGHSPAQLHRIVLLTSLSGALMSFVRLSRLSLSPIPGILSLDQLPRDFGLEPLALGIGQVLQLDVLVLLLLSTAAFFLLCLVSAQERSRGTMALSEFGILQVMGAPRRQALLVLSIELLVALLAGLLSGVCLGLFFAWIMIPFLTQELGLTAPTTIINSSGWLSVARLFVVQLLSYGAVLVLLLVVSARTQARDWPGIRHE